ncbi:MAG: cation transporter [Ktedonobacterales bacterium]
MQIEAAPRAASIRTGITIEIVTIGWMIVEAAVALGAGFASHSVSLQSFGIDSLIELFTGGVLLWRLTIEQRMLVAGVDVEATGQIEGIERRASRFAGWALYALAVYIVLDIAYGLLTRQRPESTAWGIGLALAATIIMPVLCYAKRRVAARISSAALRADAACSIVCAYMSVTLLIGLGLTRLLGWWWADSFAALALLYFIVREGREALEKASGHDSCGCGDDD